jgi:polyhydroxyalkanoate synthesis regulator phasin
MAENERIKEMKKHKKHNAIMGDIPTMIPDILEELADLRAVADAMDAELKTLRGRIKNLENKPKLLLTAGD